MHKLFIIISLIVAATNVNGQPAQATVQTVQPFGVIDTADLKLSSCNFEKDANAMVLFDKAVVTYKYESIILTRHKRIKIFNEKGKDEANIRVEYYGAHRDEVIADVEAETINLDGTAIQFTHVDKKLIYTESTDKNKKALILTFPDVRPGSVIEFTYKWTTPYPYNYPDWIFQSSIPTRYSEFDASFDHEYTFNYFRKVYQPVLKDTTMSIKDPAGVRHIWALGNIKSYKEEEYMDFPEDYLECILLKIHRVNQNIVGVGLSMLTDEDFGLQLEKKLDKQEQIINAATALKTDKEKLRYVFDTVKNSMKWNKLDAWYTIDGVKKAWDKKTGNSTEINLILYHLFKEAKVNVLLMTLKTRDDGKLDPGYISLSQLDKTVVCYPIDSLNYYILDATNKYNTYNNIPYDLNGLNAITIDPEPKKFSLLALKYGTAREATLINGIINNEGKLEGTTQISSTGYSREKYLKRYDDLGEKKYIDRMQDRNKGLKISELKIENTRVDSLPLTQTFLFKYSLTEPDGDYMYFNPNLFTGFETNPFLSESRVSNIEFGGLSNYSINGRYQIPPGYKVDALPKNTGVVMPDRSIIFRRAVGVEDNIVSVHYLIDFKRSFFTKDEYVSIREFYKKMYELLNEQIVLKKI